MNTSPRSPLGRLIEQHLGKRTLAEAARSMNLSKSYLSEIVSGKKTPELRTCIKIADALEIPLSLMARALGFLDYEDDKSLLKELLATAQKDPDLKELVKLYTQFDSPEQRRTAIRILRALLDDQEG